MFQEPKRRNEGTNLPRETQNRVRFNSGDSAEHVLSGTGAVPLVEGGGTLFKQHRHGAVQGAAVLALHRVHVARFHHIHRRRHQGGAETGGEGGGEVAGHVVCRGNKTSYLINRREKKKTIAKRSLKSPGICRGMFVLACHQLVRQDELFDDVVGHEFGAVHDGVASDVWQTTWKTQ